MRKFYWLLLFFCFLNTVGYGQCNRMSDSLELVSLYNATNGSNWTNTWDLNQPMDTWYGVTLNTNGCVTCLDLDGNPNNCGNASNVGNNLVGNLPNLTLAELNGLYLRDNQLNGNMPSLSNLPKLGGIDITNNQLTGNMPDFTNNPFISEIRLSNNQLSGNFPNLPYLMYLGFMDISSNMITGNIPDFYASGLAWFYASNNQLSGNIPDFSYLITLTYLDLSNNQLNGSIPNFSNLGNLREVDLSSNQLIGNIPNFSSLGLLNKLNLGDNQLSGSIPDFSLPWLQILGLAKNQLSDTIPNFSNFSNLTNLSLSENQLIGNIPDFSLPNLQYLFLNDNQLIGNIPDFSNLSNLKQLYLNNNQLYNTIPDFSNLTNLTILDISNNQLIGNIPDFSNLNNLTTLKLSYNLLNDTIPNFSNLISLNSLLLIGNQLSGNIPDFVMLPNISQININDNQLTGSIPNFTLSNKLRVLRCENNQLSGSIPSFSNLLYSIQIYADNNQFTSCDSLFNALTLYCRYNNLTFEGIITNIGNITNTFLYNPQDTVGILQNISLNTSQTYTIDLGFDDTLTTSTYTWYKDGIQIATTNTNQYTIVNAQLSDAGQYEVQINNSVATQLTLYTQPIIVQVEESCRYLDSLALVELYDSLGGSGWIYDDTTYSRGNVLITIPNANSSWNFNQPINTWHGIKLDTNGCVEKIILPGSNLTGKLFNIVMPNLKELSIYSNQLIDTIPNFSGLPNLEWLELSANQLSGIIPNFSNLPKLQDLYLRFNQLSGNIPNFSNISNLDTLFIDFNQLVDTIPNFSNLPNLEFLKIGSAEFSQYNPNNITGIIPNFSNLPNLKSLDLSGLSLSGTIPNFSNLPNLSGLYLRYNQLSGTIPNFLNLTNLKDISLDYNELNSGVSNLLNLPNLTYILISNNKLEDYVPSFKNKSDSLRYLYLYHNQLTFEDITNSLIENRTLVNNNGFYSYERYNYSPQDSAGTIQTIYATNTENITLTLPFDDTVTTSTYYWYKDGILIDSTTINQYTINNVQFSDAGQYDVRITNSIATELTLYAKPITLNVCPKIDIIQDTVICVGETVTLDAQNTGASYSWNTLETTQSISVSASNDYIIEMTAGGCTVRDTITVMVTEPNVNLTQINTSLCAEDNTNAVTVSPSDGSSIYTYAWNNNQTSTTATNLSAGWHYVTATDIYQCEITDSILVNEPTALTSSMQSTDVLCFQNADGTATVTPQGGTPNYTYNWSNNATLATTAGLDIGFYYVTITDNNGCVLQDTVIINQPPPLIATDTAKTKTCNPGNIGTAHALALGGTSPYNYLWSNGDNTALASGLSQGYHTVTVTDANNCTATHDVLIDTSYYFFNITLDNQPTCHGLNDGSATLTNFNGSYPPYTYQWDNGETTPQANSLNGGLHFATVTDVRGCQAFASINIIEPDSLYGYTQKHNDVLCFGESNGSAEAIITGGTSPYIVDWGSGLIANPNNNLSAGFYQITITDVNNCSYTDTITIDEPSELLAATATTSDSCDGNSGTMSVSPSGGTPPYNYAWSPNVSVVSMANQIGFGTYYVTVTDNNGCTVVVNDNVQRECDSCDLFNPITFPSNPKYIYECLGDGTAIVKLQVIGGAPEYYGNGLYNFFVTGSSSPAYPQGYYYSSDGYFEFEVVDGDSWQVVIADSSGCHANNANDVFTNHPDDCSNYCEVYPAQLTVIPDTFVVRGNPARLWAVGNGNILWTPSTGLSCTTCFNPTSDVQQSVYYYITLVDTAGCEARDTFELDIVASLNPNDIIEDPIVVTPNGDGFNDVLYFDNLEHFPENSLTIFNRWGMKVYHVQNYDNTFDGIIDGVVKLPQGTYYYYLKPKGRLAPQGGNEPMKGYFTLVRYD